MSASTLVNSYGAIYLGVVFCSILFGTATLQTLTYHTHYPGDDIRQKLKVASLWTLIAFHAALTIHTGYYYSIGALENLDQLLQVPWTSKARVVVDVVIINYVPTLYVFRIRKLGKMRYKYVSWFITLTLPIAYGIAILILVKTFDHYDASVLLQGFQTKVYPYLIASFAYMSFMDIIIAFAMCFYLQKNRRALDSTGTRAMIWRIMMFTLTSGALTAACSLISLITLVTMPKKFYWLLFEYLTAELYVNSYLSMLNSRSSLRKKSQFHQSAAGDTSVVKFKVTDRDPPSMTTMTTTHRDSLQGMGTRTPSSSRTPSSYSGSRCCSQTQFLSIVDGSVAHVAAWGEDDTRLHSGSEVRRHTYNAAELAMPTSVRTNARREDDDRRFMHSLA